MKYALLAALVCTMALMSCTDEDAIVSSSPDSVNAAKMTISGGKAGGGGSRSGLATQGYRELVSTGTNTTGMTVSAGRAGGYRGNRSSPADEDQAVDIGFIAMVTSDEEQAMIDEKVAVIKEYYAEKEPDHFLILVGNKETLVADMSCNSHDQAVVEQMLSGGNPRFLHLAPKEDIAEGALNGKYRDAPDNIKEAIQYVNQFSSNVGAVSDAGGAGIIAFNYTNEELGIVQGNCQDLGVHHLGLFKDTRVVEAMNSAGYGVATWNGLPVYAGYNCNANWEDSYKLNSSCDTCKKCYKYADSTLGFDESTYSWVGYSKYCFYSDSYAAANPGLCDGGYFELEVYCSAARNYGNCF